MANIIDAFFITLGLDAREYEKKRKEVDQSLKKFGDASSKQTKLIAEHGKKAAGAFSALKIEILGALAAFGMGAGFKSFIESSMNAQASAGRTAEALGVSVQSMRAYKLMASEMGESGDAAVSTLQKVAAGMAAARSGDTSFLTAGSQYGVVLNVSDNVETTLSKLNERAFAIKQRYGGAQASAFLSNYGITDTAQQTQLMEKPAQYAAEYASAMQKVGVWTQDDIAKSKLMQKQWADFMQKMENLKIKVFDKLEPIIERLGTEFANWADSVDWDKVIDQLGKFLGQLNKVINALGGVKGILIEIAAIKVFGWVTSIAGWVIKLKSLTAALKAARLAAAAGGAGAAASGAGAAAAGGAMGLLRKIGAVTGAGAAGWFIGDLINRHFVEGTKFGDAIGEGEAHVAAFFGSSDARDAIAQSNANAARQKAAQAKNISQTFSSLESKYGLPSGLLDSVYSAESSRGKHLVSPKGALGPFQFMPATAAQYGLTGSDVNDTSKAADAAARYLHNLIAQFNGNIPAAIAAYNWGPGNVQRKGMGALPKETSDYITKVLGGMSGYVGARAESPKSGNSSTTNTVSIGTMNVNAPKATDANGIARSAQKAFRTNPLIQGSVTVAS